LRGCAQAGAGAQIGSNVMDWVASLLLCRGLLPATVIDDDYLIRWAAGRRMEAIMAIVRFNALRAAAVAATMITVSPALGRDMDDGGFYSWRSPASSAAPPVVGSANFPEDARRLPVCHVVKQRIGTHNGHAVYQTRQVCG
jgi:hypothetical protein